MTERFDEYPNVAARDAAWEARAIKWSAFILVGGTRFHDEFPTLKEAATSAQEFETICAKYGLTNKRALVYAITAENHAVMVQREKWKQAIGEQP